MRKRVRESRKKRRRQTASRECATLRVSKLQCSYPLRERERIENDERVDYRGQKNVSGRVSD